MLRNECCVGYWKAGKMKKLEGEYGHERIESHCLP